jgi:hypothetical protein
MLVVQILAALAWIKMAFARRVDDGPNHEIKLNDELLQIFVNFYWKLYQGQSSDADLFLQGERKKRGYESFAYTMSSSAKPTRLSESNAVHVLPKKEGVPSRRVSVSVKKELLRDGSQGRLRNELLPTSANRPVTSGLPKLKCATLLGQKKSRRSKRGRAGDTHRDLPPTQPPGRSIVLSSTDSTLEKTLGIGGKHRPHLLSEALETSESQDVLRRDACRSSQSWSHPLLSSRSQSYPLPEGKPYMSRLSGSNGQHFSFAHILYRDETGTDEVPMSGCRQNVPMRVGDTKTAEIDDSPVDVYRCKPPLDNFPPIWAQVIQSLEVSINTYAPN